MMYENNNIPNTIKECTRETIVVKELRNWSDVCKNIGNIGGSILLVIGVIGLYIMAGDGDMEFAFVYITLPMIISAVILYGSLKGMSILLGALAEIVYNTSVTANTALFTASQKGNVVVLDEKNETKSGVKPEAKPYNFDAATSYVKSGSEWKCAS